MRTKRRTRRLVVLSAITAVGVLGSMAGSMVSAGAAEDESADIPTTAVLTPGAGQTAPLIECAWSIPDQDNLLEGFQYKSPFEDDDPATNANGATPSGAQDQPCYKPAGADPTQTENATRMIQVRPYAHDWNADPLDDRTQGEVSPAGGIEDNVINFQTPALDNGRLIDSWVAADRKNGSPITSVFVDVIHPNNTFKHQVYGTKVPCQGAGSTEVQLNSSMWQTAVNTNQVEPAAITASGSGMYDLCLQGQKEFWRVRWAISKEQMCGEYKVINTAQNALGLTDTLTYFLDVLCFIHLEIDFPSVDFGSINTNGTSLITGDTSMTTPLKPTVRNTGNTGMMVGLRIFPMCLLATTPPENPPCQSPNPKYITIFDAKFTNDGSLAPQIHDPINVPTAAPGFTEVWFDGSSGSQTAPNSQVVLCANKVGKLDLSIHPDLQTNAPPPAGSYKGKIVVLGAWWNNVCANDVASPDAGQIFSDDDPAGVGNTTPHLP